MDLTTHYQLHKRTENELIGICLTADTTKQHDAAKLLLERPVDDAIQATLAGIIYDTEKSQFLYRILYQLAKRALNNVFDLVVKSYRSDMGPLLKLERHQTKLELRWTFGYIPTCPFSESVRYRVINLDAELVLRRLKTRGMFADINQPERNVGNDHLGYAEAFPEELRVSRATVVLAHKGLGGLERALELINDDDPAVVEVAAMVISKSDDLNIETLLASANTGLAIRALVSDILCEGVWRINNQKLTLGLQFLRAVSKDRTIRYMALKLLERSDFLQTLDPKIYPTIATELLLPLALDYPDMSMLATSAVGKMGKDLAPTIVTAMPNNERAVVLVSPVLEVMGDSAIAPLCDALNDPNRAMSAAIVLQRFGDAPLVEVLSRDKHAELNFSDGEQLYISMRGVHAIEAVFKHLASRNVADYLDDENLKRRAVSLLQAFDKNCIPRLINETEDGPMAILSTQVLSSSLMIGSSILDRLFQCNTPMALFLLKDERRGILLWHAKTNIEQRIASISFYKHLGSVEVKLRVLETIFNYLPIEPAERVALEDMVLSNIDDLLAKAFREKDRLFAAFLRESINPQFHRALATAKPSADIAREHEDLLVHLGVRVVPCLLELLGSTDLELKDRARQVLKKIGRPALPWLRTALTMEREGVSIEALRLIEHLPAAENDRFVLDVACRTKNSGIRQAAISAIGDITTLGERAFEFSMSCVRANDSHLQIAALGQLAQFQLQAVSCQDELRQLSHSHKTGTQARTAFERLFEALA